MADLEQIRGELVDRFAALHAKPILVPLKISFAEGSIFRKKRYEGEGLRFEVWPLDDKAAESWEWWGYHEEEVMIRCREERAATWNDLYGAADLARALLAQAKEYLSQLAMGQTAYEELSGNDRSTSELSDY